MCRRVGVPSKDLSQHIQGDWRAVVHPEIKASVETVLQKKPVPVGGDR